MFRKNMICLMMTSGVLAFPAISAAQDRTDLQGRIDRILDRDLKADGVDRTTLIDDVQALKVGSSSKWIGVMCRQVDEVLRAHMDIPAGVGLIIEEVLPDSPAANSGLEQFDILLEANGEALRSQELLVKAVREAGDNPLKLTWLRRGDEMTGTVQPADRPKNMGGWGGDIGAWGNQQDMNRLKAWVERLERGDAGGKERPFRLRFFGPEMNLRGRLEALPNNLSIQIQKQGDEPAKIKVEKGDSTWELTENDLDQLPDDVRPHVENMLNGTRFRVGVGEGEGLFLPELELDLPRLNERFEEMNERMEKMFDELRQLRGIEEQRKDNDDLDA